MIVKERNEGGEDVKKGWKEGEGGAMVAVDTLESSSHLQPLGSRTFGNSWW
jgi:hypothetical protein